MTQTISQGVVERRTSKRSSNQDVSLDLIYDLLEKASYAPFHKREPWQAKIITRSTEKEHLYQHVIATLERNGTIKDDTSRERFETKMTRLLKQSPATILFAREIITDNLRLNSDAIQGTAALIQNFSLLAYEAGLVGFWASSPFIMDQTLSLELGFPSNYELIANYRLGYPEVDGPQRTAIRSDVRSWATPLL